MSILFLSLLASSSAQERAKKSYAVLDSLYYRCFDYIDGNNEEFEKFLQLYILEVQKWNDSLHLGYVWDLKGQRAYLDDQIDSALIYQLRALTIFTKVGDFEGQSIAHYNLSSTYIEMGRVDQALFHIKRYRSIDRLNASTISSDVFFYSDLADIYHRQGAAVFALNILKKYRPFLDSIKYEYPYFSPLYLTQMAESYLAIDSLQQASVLLTQAQEQLGEDSTSFSFSYLSSIRAQYFLLSKQIPKALIFINKSIKIDSLNGTKYDLALSRIKRAEINLAKGDINNAQRDIEKAANYLNSRNYRYTGTQEYLRVKQKLDSAKGDFFSAYNSLYRLDSLKRLSHSQNLSGLLLEMEADQQRITNEHLIEANALQADKLLWRQYLLFALLVIFILLAFLTFREKKRRRVLQGAHIQLAKRNAEIKAQAQGIEQQSIAIAKSNAKLRDLDNTKNRLLSILSHDLQQPFNQMRQVLDILRSNESEINGDLKSLIEDLHQTVGQSSEVVQQLLMWTKAQFEGYQVHKAPIVVEAAVKKALLELRFEFKAKGLQIDLSLLHNATVNFDPDHLRFILRNLLKNAIKFSPRQGRIGIATEECGDRVIIAVEDDGPGIEAFMKKQILDGNNQHSLLGTENEEGTGLGLRIVKDFLRENQSELVIESELGKGSVFKISIPRVQATSMHES